MNKCFRQRIERERVSFAGVYVSLCLPRWCCPGEGKETHANTCCHGDDDPAIEGQEEHQKDVGLGYPDEVDDRVDYILGCHEGQVPETVERDGEGA